jgi:iron(III) transport system substrate-binding protein
MRSKILTEARAGRHVYDVTSMNVVDTGLLMRKGIVGPYKALARKGIQTGLKDKEGYWTAIYLRQFVLTYNTQTVQKDEAPKDWWELLLPKWKGRIGMDQEETEWYAALVTYWGKEKAQKLLKGLAAQNPTIHRGHTLIAQLTSAGAFDLSIAYGNRVEEMKGKGAPLDFVDTTDPIVTSPTVITLSAHAPHPNAGRLYIEFVLSPEGQTVLRNFGRVAANKDVPLPSPKLDPNRLKSFFVNPSIADRYEEFQKDYYKIFGR